MKSKIYSILAVSFLFATLSINLVNAQEEPTPPAGGNYYCSHGTNQGECNADTPSDATSGYGVFNTWVITETSVYYYCWAKTGSLGGMAYAIFASDQGEIGVHLYSAAQEEHQDGWFNNTHQPQTISMAVYANPGCSAHVTVNW